MTRVESQGKESQFDWEKKKEKAKDLVPVKLIYEFFAKLEIDIFNSFAKTVPRISGFHII